MTRLGQQEPVIVEQITDRRYQLIEGHRRRKAARLAGISHLDAVLRRRPGDCNRILRQLAMHTHARPFEPTAEAKALHRLRWEYRLGLEQIAVHIGRSPPGYAAGSPYCSSPTPTRPTSPTATCRSGPPSTVCGNAAQNATATSRAPRRPARTAHAAKKTTSPQPTRSPRPLSSAVAPSATTTATG